MESIRLRVLIAIAGFLSVGFWLALSMPVGLSKELAECYWSILGTFTVISTVFIYALSRYDFVVFEPVMLFIIMYFGIFVFRPLSDIKNGDYYTFGVNPMNGGVKANFVVCLSVISFFMGYYKSFTVKGRQYTNAIYYKEELETNTEINVQALLSKAYVVWTISFVVSVINLLLSGKNLIYIFSFGNGGFISDDATAGGIAALSFFSYSMIAPWLYICIYEKKKSLMVLLSFLMICVYVVRGTRIVLLVMLSAPILYHYISQRKKPKLKTVVCGVFILLLIMSFMQATRNGLRTGTDIKIDDFSSIAITNVFDADLTTYKQFYCIVEKYPSQYNYTLGRAMILQTLTTIIPRSLWSSKPEPVVTEIIKNAVNQRAADSGMASPGIGEYYFEFGIIGCIVCMFLLGCLFKRWNKLRSYENIESWIMYCTLYGLIFQLIIRTSTASCVYQYFFTIFPIYFISKTKLLDGK